jgi:hypothetical protein
VYSDGLASGWESWSWSVDLDLASSSPVHSGSASLAVTYTGGWGALFLHSAQPMSSTELDRLVFHIHGGSAGGQQLSVTLMSGGDQVGEAVEVEATAGAWTAVAISMADIGSPGSFDGIAWQDATGGPQPTYYLDDIGLIESETVPLPGWVSIQVDAGGEQLSISPYIYGMNHADEALADELDLPVRRWGGNHTSRYNWQVDAHNRTADWYFENIAVANDSPEQLPVGSATDRFVEQDRRTGARTMLTVSILGYTPYSREFNCSFRVSKYGEQQESDPWNPDCGNGIALDGSAIVNDPTDTNIAVGIEFHEDWIAHLQSRFGTADEGGVLFWELDNEPMLWFETHRDVHPEPTSYDEIRDLSLSYGAMIRRLEPEAVIVGPSLWGWSAYFWSALDWESGDAWWNYPQDRMAHDDEPFANWYLEQMAAYEQEHGERILDLFDLHFYPQDVSLRPAGDRATQALRLRSTRLLWDQSYVEETWIQQPVYLIPRMHQLVNDSYPGTGIAITEYNWGGHEHINGALAQADVLGIFGAEGLDLATIWDPPESDQPGAFAFRMYRNYDGNGARFGSLGVPATSSDRSRVAVYAALTEDRRKLTMMLINKADSPITGKLEVHRFSAVSPVQIYRYSEADLSAIVREADLAQLAGALELPPRSITLVVALSRDWTSTRRPSVGIGRW